jgi:hypothetical protein
MASARRREHQARLLLIDETELDYIDMIARAHLVRTPVRTLEPESPISRLFDSCPASSSP